MRKIGLSLLLLGLLIAFSFPNLDASENKNQTRLTEAPATPGPALIHEKNWLERRVNKIKIFIEGIKQRIHDWRLLGGIHEGITESEVRERLGKPDYDRFHIIREPGFLGSPDLPRGTKYKSLNYFVEDTVYVYLISPEDYSKITGKEKSGTDWIVYQVGVISKDIDF